MHVVHIVPAITIGGLWRLLQAATRMAKHGSQATVVSIFNLDQNDAIRHLNCRLIQLGRAVSELEQREYISSQIRAILDQLSPDIVQSHHLYSDLYAIPAARISRIKVIRTVHGITQATKSSPLRRDAIKTEWTDDEIRAELEIEDDCSGTLTVSSNLRDRLVSYGFAPSKIAVLYPGVDLATATRRKRRGEECQTIIGYVGRLEMVKNPLIMPQVARELLDKGYDIRFLVIGDGRQRESLIEELGRLKLSSRFTLVPPMTDIRELYDMIDVALVPSISEGLPLVVLEAMAFGVPVVATNVGGIPEVITDGKNGFLCNPGDSASLSEKLAYLIDSKNLRDSFISAGRETVAERFSMKKHLQCLAHLYHQVMEGTPIGAT